MTRPTAIGRLRYDPRGASVPYRPWWLVLQCDGDWHRRLLVDVRGKLPQAWRIVTDPDRNVGKTRDVPHLGRVGRLIRPAWGCHISILRGERPTKNAGAWGRDNGFEVTFEYDPDPWYNNEYVWYDVYSEGLLDMREAYGLRREPKQALHLTVARWAEDVPPWLGGEKRRF